MAEEADADAASARDAIGYWLAAGTIAALLATGLGTLQW